MDDNILHMYIDFFDILAHYKIIIFIVLLHNKNKMIRKKYEQKTMVASNFGHPGSV